MSRALTEVCSPGLQTAKSVTTRTIDSAIHDGVKTAYQEGPTSSPT